MPSKDTGALAPGKPAGVKQAQELGDATLVILGIAAIRRRGDHCRDNRKQRARLHHLAVRRADTFRPFF